MSPKKRSTHKHLPQRVYFKHNAYFFVDRNNKWHKLGTSLAEAMQKYAEMIESPLANNTMNALFDRYLKEISTQKSPATNRQDIYSMKKLRVFFGLMNPEDITPVDVYKYMDMRKKTSIVSANKEKSLLSHVLNTAIKWGALSDNICRHVERLPEAKRLRYIEDWEFKAVFDIAPDLIKAAMMIGYLTGLRLGDLLKLKLSDLTEHGIKVDINKTKNAILIEWSDELRAAIELAKKLSRNVRGFNLLCTQKGQPYTADGFKTLWQRVMNKAMGEIKAKENGVIVTKKVTPVLTERFRFHDIRRKAATDIEAKHGREFARKLLGHSTQKMTENYIAGMQKVRPVR